jgi:hypothetical protein
VALALGEDRDQHVGAGHFLAARGLDMDHGALDDALEAGGRLGVAAAGTTRLSSSVVDDSRSGSRAAFEIDVAGAHDGGASWSSVSASSRCSSVAYSCGARWRGQRAVQGCSRLRENEGMGIVLLLFHRALQRMLVLAGEIHDLGDLGLGHFVGEDAADPDAVVVDVQHDAVASSRLLLKNRSSTCTTNSIGV